jgi:precorrin-2 dehydrogenase/sirohydrochlorin ferrochelatase
MKLYPIFLNITNRKVVIIGGGEVALRKIRDLLKAGARISAISPVFHQDILKLSDEHGDNLELIEREYREGDLFDTSLAFSATDDPEINRRVFDEAEKKNIFINSADDPPNCSFIVPSSSQRGDLILALSTGGASPAMSARLRRELESHIPDNIEKILEVLREAREILKSKKDFSSLSASQRGELLKRIANDDTLLEELVSSRDDDLIAFLSKLIQSKT